jgi:hypothetical protein
VTCSAVCSTRTGELHERVYAPFRVAERQQAPQDRLALPETETGHVAAVHVQDVEQVQVDGDAGAAGRVGVAELHAPLQPGEAGATACEGDHLPVHHEVVGLLRRQGLCQLRVVVVQLLAVAGQQPDLRPLRKARQRSPSNFGSNTQPVEGKFAG